VFSLYQNITKAITAPEKSCISLMFWFFKYLVCRSVESEGEKKLLVAVTGRHREWRKSHEIGGCA